ncbi:MAG: aspartate--tRNA ligase [Oscillospiraceae bacterium]|nr:aspartate--tRNA ligase [Oscillospiraceae bacterium]
MKKLKRTHYCSDIDNKLVGQDVVVCGFVQKVRNLGNLIFIDIRDRSGSVQVAFDNKTDQKLLEIAQKVRSEFVVAAKGSVKIRDSINETIKNGDIEIYVSDFDIISKASTPPFEILDNINVKEELRLKYRYLDLRRPELQKTLIMRHKIVKVARDYYDENGFLEIETPMLIKSTPEGARDYLVPSRVHQGCFFALPQSPQLYKQLLMVAGYDRYMQVARCFRDEDLRADRQPEFTQIDLEMSFVDENDVMSINEGFIKYLFKKIMNIDIKTPFLKLKYSEAMERFGSDKPDTRFGLELVDLTSILNKTEFKVFASAISQGGSVRAINVKNSAKILTRKEIDKLTEVIKTYRGKGLAFSRYTEDGVSSSFEKFLSEQEIKEIYEKLNFEKDDVILIVADKNNIVFDCLGNLRCHLGKKLNLINKNDFNFLWVTDFPLFEYDEEEKRYVSKHHPFTSPKLDQLDKLDTNPGEVLASAYDMVLNGCEVGGGSIRIFDQELQQKIFNKIGLSKEEADQKFGFLLEAFKYGVPPHGGMAYGLDRLVMLMLNKESIRDVIAFPKVQNSGELMTGCPATVDESSLRDLGLKK